MIKVRGMSYALCVCLVIYCACLANFVEHSFECEGPSTFHKNGKFINFYWVMHASCEWYLNPVAASSDCYSYIAQQAKVVESHFS